MDEITTPQKLAAEVLGTALLVFIGVGSVPATLIVNGDAPFTMADLGMISLAFGTIVVATVYALGHVSGNHINPAVTVALAATGKFSWTRVPAYLVAQLTGATIDLRAIVGPEQTVLYSYSLDGGKSYRPFGAGIALSRFSWWKGSRPALFTFTRGETGSIDVDWFRVEHRR